MMWPYGQWHWFPLMWIFPLIFLVVLLLVLIRGGSWSMCGGRDRRGRDDSAREILDRRYARGEITEEEYQRMKKNLE